MNVVKLTNDKLSIGSIYDSVCSPEFGAVSLFVGTTRNNFEGKTVMKLEYEAYEQMAVKTLLQLCGNIRKNYQVGNIAIYHRLGNVPIQEASVVIAISSTHRQSALEAVPYAIDALKAETPIWKKEIYDDEHPPEWKENSEWKQSFTSADVSSNCHLYEEEVEMDVGNEVPSHLIQVKANLKEINRRINSFIHRKREQINASNIQNFLSGAAEDGTENTCARVSAVLKRRTDSKGHLKVHRVANAIGPQTQGPGVRATAGTGTGDSCPPGAEERIANAETHLGLSPRSKTADVFSRLKAIEDRILFLESISPEYFDPRKQEPKAMHNRTSCLTKRKYTFSDLDTKMKQLEARLLEKDQKKKMNFEM